MRIPARQKICWPRFRFVMGSATQTMLSVDYIALLTQSIVVPTVSQPIWSAFLRSTPNKVHAYEQKSDGFGIHSDDHQRFSSMTLFA